MAANLDVATLELDITEADDYTVFYLQSLADGRWQQHRWHCDSAPSAQQAIDLFGAGMRQQFGREPTLYDLRLVACLPGNVANESAADIPGSPSIYTVFFSYSGGSRYARFIEAVTCGAAAFESVMYQTNGFALIAAVVHGEHSVADFESDTWCTLDGQPPRGYVGPAPNEGPFGGRIILEPVS